MKVISFIILLLISIFGDSFAEEKKANKLWMVERVCVNDTQSCAVVNGTTFCWGKDFGSVARPCSIDCTDAPDESLYRHQGYYFKRWKSPYQPYLQQAAAKHGLKNISVASGFHEYQACAISEGYVWCWGDNLFGELGDGSQKPSSVPVKVKGIPAGVDILAAASWGHRCVAKSSQASQEPEVYCWGLNSFNQLGRQTTDQCVWNEGCDGCTDIVELCSILPGKVKFDLTNADTGPVQPPPAKPKSKNSSSDFNQRLGASSTVRISILP